MKIDLQLTQKPLLYALEIYKSFLMAKFADNEINYFIQWQVGMVEAAGYRIAAGRGNPFKSNLYNPARAEAMNMILLYDTEVERFGMTYITRQSLSSVLRAKYLKIWPSLVIRHYTIGNY